MNFIETIKKLLIYKGMTQSELAERIGFSEVYLSDIMRGKKGKNMSVANLAKFARALDVPITYFFTQDQNELNQNSVRASVEKPAVHVHYGYAPKTVNKNDFEFIPLHRTFPSAESDMITIENNNNEWAAMPSKLLKTHGSVKAYRISGDSMSPILKDGDIIFTKIYESPKDTADNEKIYLCKTEQDSEAIYTFRKAHLSGGQYLTLFPLNPSHKIIEFNLGKVKTYPPIIGHAVWQWRNIEQG